MLLLKESKIRGGISTVMVNKYVESEEKKIFLIGANNLHGWAMMKSLPFMEIELITQITLDELPNTPIDNEIGHFNEVDSQYPK